MEDRSRASPEQLHLQARIAQRRINEIERILKSGVQAPASSGTDEETAEVVRRLYDSSLSDADISSCIGILEMLLLVEGLAPLLNVMKSESYGMSVRQQAAKAISVIGSSYVEKELGALRSSASPKLRSLAEVALGISVGDQ